MKITILFVLILTTILTIADLSGAAFDDAIPLLVSWNLLGCPISVGYHNTEDHPNVLGVTKWVKVNPPVADYVFDSIKNNYSMITGEHGAYNPALPPASSSVHYIVPNDAFWVKITQAAELTYPND